MADDDGGRWPDPMLVGFHLLDRQIEDMNGEPVGKVDDVELAFDEDGVPYVAALRSGQTALGDRFVGALGRWISGAAARLDVEHRGPRRISWDLIDKVDSAVILKVRQELLPDPPLESWLANHLIGRIPGAGHEPA